MTDFAVRWMVSKREIPFVRLYLYMYFAKVELTVVDSTNPRMNATGINEIYAQVVIKDGM